MTDIFEHSLGGRLDVDLFGGDAKRRHQLPSIALGRVAGREAWKGEAHDIGARPLKAVHRFRRDDESMGGIEAARNTDDDLLGASRSEEHTSELQSLMRISYAVFCFKTKIRQQKHEKIHYTM